MACFKLQTYLEVVEYTIFKVNVQKEYTYLSTEIFSKREIQELVFFQKA